MAMITLLCQDLPQIITHIIFLLVQTAIPHGDLTVKLSLIGTVLAAGVSLFNVIEAAPNEFDPKLLDKELDRRKLRLLIMGRSVKSETKLE